MCLPKWDCISINAIIVLKEIHKRRPWYQKLFGYFGQVGKELPLAEQLKADLVRRGVPAGALTAALDGDSVAKAAILEELPTKEDRIKAQDEQDRKDFYRSIGIKGPDDNRLLIEIVYDEDGHPSHNYYIKVSGLDFNIPNRDVIKYLNPQDMLNKEVFKQNEKEIDQEERDEAVGLIDQFLLAKDQSKATQDLINDLENEFEEKKEEDPFLDDASVIEAQVDENDNERMEEASQDSFEEEKEIDEISLK